MVQEKSSLYRCGIYVRVSTEEQAENPEGSIKNQAQRLCEFVKLKNLVTPFGEVTGVYSDPGFSAKDMNRPGFQKMLQSIERREINVILVTEISRLTRSMKDFGLLQEFLRKHECEFLSLRENFDTSSATGGMVLNIMASIAEFERRQTAERISQAFLARAKRGLYNGGSVPLGYEVHPDVRGSLRVVPEEAEIVKLVFATFLKTETMLQTARWLNEHQIELPRRMNGGGSLRGRIFRLETVHKILRNPMYAGVRVFRVKLGASFVDEQTKAVWEPIIEEAIFQRVQELLTKNRYRKRTHLNLRYPFTLSGICYCQACGDRMSGKSAHGRNAKIPYYEHAWATKQQEALSEQRIKCQPHRLQATKIEPEVWNDVKLFLTREEFVREIMASVKRVRPIDDLASDRKQIETKIQSTSKQIEVLAGRIAELPEAIDPQALYEQLGHLQKTRSDAEKTRSALSAEQAPLDESVDFESLQSFTAGFRSLLEQANSNPEMRTAVIRKVVHRVEVTIDGYEIFFHIGQGYFEREFKSKGEASSLSETKLETISDPKNKKRGLDFSRPPSKPLSKFFSDRGSKRLVSGGASLRRLPVSHSRASLQPGLCARPAQLGTRALPPFDSVIKVQNADRVLAFQTTKIKNPLSMRLAGNLFGGA